MCSWCWGFEPVRASLFEALPSKIDIQRLVGGLAPDSDMVMPLEMQTFLKSTWLKIQKSVPGTQFNFEFWKNCQPRRSTYPSNRAVIAARLQHSKFDSLMTHRIQQAYYLQAKNPSDMNVLIELAADIGLNVDRFKSDCSSPEMNELLNKEIRFTRELGLNSFPSLAILGGGRVVPVKLDYLNANSMVQEIISEFDSEF